MAYPTLEQYNEVFQYPQLALADPVLKSGQIKMTGMGTPLALCGGFALTYTLNVSNKKYAIRCFHKQSLDLENRYIAISSKIKNLNSSYFLDFEFQPKGIKVNNNYYPLVKMAWADGITLGEFLEQSHKNKAMMQDLQKSLRNLAAYLELNKVAHGDISPDNIMVSNNGNNLQLIDYDGMYVDTFQGNKSTELGNRNFQHIKRTADNFNHTLDRFSFILLDVAIEALTKIPNLWKSTQSEATAVVFRANDYASPENSNVFQELFQNASISDIAKRFAAISKADFDQIPSLSDFIANKNIPQISLSKITAKVSQYLAAFPVIDATNYNLGLKHVGDRIELIGKIIDVKSNTARNGKPYVFINFGHWKGNIIKLSIWSEGLDVLTNKPNQAWIGQWVSVSGLMDPAYVNPKFNYSHLSIGITKNNQIQFITEVEAKFRLAGSTTRTTNNTSNRELLKPDYKPTKPTSISRAGNSITVPSPNPILTSTPKTTNNQAILQKIKANQSSNTNTAQSTSPQYKNIRSFPTNTTSTKPTPTSPQKTNSGNNCFIATAVYGYDAYETNVLRAWRDTYLLKRKWGVLFVVIYYKVSPKLVRIIDGKKLFHKLIKFCLDNFVKLVDRSNR